MSETKEANAKLYPILLMQLVKDILLKKKKTVPWKDSTLSLKDIERFQETHATVVPNLSHIEEHALLSLSWVLSLALRP